MKALSVKDELNWRDRWSVELGKNLEISDSTNNVLVFKDKYSEKEIRDIVSDAPNELFEIVDLEEAPKESCDFMADSGTCYRKRQ